MPRNNQRFITAKAQLKLCRIAAGLHTATGRTTRIHLFTFRLRFVRKSRITLAKTDAGHFLMPRFTHSDHHLLKNTSR
jgi:hypothetical protein